MKKFLFLMVVLTTFLSGSAQTRTDSDGNTVYHPLSVVAQYQIRDFEDAEDSGSYGLGMVFSSISHWGRFHLGGNLNFSLNAGLVDNWGCIIDFGPSARIDISKHLFVNIPVNAVCNVMFPEGSSDTETTWGARISPSLYAFLSDRFGLFVGPQVSCGFSDGSSPTFGMQAGLSYTF